MEKLQSILNYSVGSFTVGKIFEAVIVFVICYFLIRIIMKVLKRVLGKTSLDATLSKIIAAVIRSVSPRLRLWRRSRWSALPHLSPFRIRFQTLQAAL